ncbi:MAG TPA: alpha/beta fold hydrolase [Acidimicrobiales bacterium]|nr:alpha/beta fold hydrolase [Acidimicrobiales bacterium]
MTTARVNGIELYYELHGRGPAVTVIPGLGADTRMFSPIVTALAQRYQVLVFDPRGAGRSEKPDVCYSAEEMADDTAGLLDVAGMHAPMVIGYSMGGRIALSLILRHPDRVRGLLLAATSARTPPTRPLTRRWLMMDVLGRIRLPIDPQPRYARQRQREAFRNFDCSDRLGQIRVPTTVIHGRDDHVTPYAFALELQSGIPGARLVPVKGGHFSLLTTQRSRLIQAAEALDG